MDKKRIAELDNLIISALNNDIFPCAAVAFTQWNGKNYDCFNKKYGYAQLIPDKRILKKNDFFDLASLTKAITTVPLVLYLIEKKSIQLDTRLSDIFFTCPKDKRAISIRQLLSHSSGLPAYREYFKELIKIPLKERKENLLKKILNEKLDSEPGTGEDYSDLGFILLGFIIEKVTGKELDVLAENNIYNHLKLQNDLFFPGINKNKDKGYVCTEKCIWEQKMLCGLVHDDNCRAVGGVTGHAGLFGTLNGVIKFTESLLDQWQGRAEHPAYGNTLLRQAMSRKKRATWTLGFDTPSIKGSSSGNYFSKESVGHLGFTGTSFWIDPQKDCIAILLTNRVHPNRDNWKIKEFRPLFHDILMK